MLERGLVGPGARVLFPCAEDARRDLERALGAAGVGVERLPTYRTVPHLDPELDPGVHARVFMSPSSVRAAGAWERAHPARATRRFAVGATTADELRRAGLEADSTASAPEGLAPVEALVQHLARLAAGGAVRA
jgi:uroporphyrinogen-III synthase